MMELALAIDVGGTKLAAGIVDGDGRLLERASVATYDSPGRPGTSHRPATPNPDHPGSDRPGDGGEELFARIAGLVARFEPYDRFSCCGVGCAGPMTPGGELVSPLNIPAWRSFPLAARLAEVTGLRCRVHNDAKALALAEGWIGAAVGVDDYLAMVVSTGIGGGIVLDGRLFEGGTGNAGHIGQMVEAAGAGDSIACGRHPRGRGIGDGHRHPQRARAEEASTAVIAEAGTFVGRAVASVANLLDLNWRGRRVGGLGLGEPFFAAAQAEVDRICRLDHDGG